MMSTRIHVMCFVFSACSMLYYLLYSKLVAELTRDVSTWASICTATYLLTLGLGMIWTGKRRFADEYKSVGNLEFWIAAAAPAAITFVYLWHLFYRIYIFDFGYLTENKVPRSWYFGLIAQIPLAVIGVLSGIEGALLHRLCFRAGLHHLQRLIATYYFGGLLGSLTLTLCLSPHIEPFNIIILGGFINLLAALYWQTKLAGKNSLKSSGLAISSVLLSYALIGTGFWIDLPQLQRKNYYYNHYSWEMDSHGILSFQFPKTLLSWWRESESYPSIERHIGPYQAIDFVLNPKAQLRNKPEWTMMMNGRFQVSSSFESAYHQTLAHVPSLLQGHSGQDILVVGGGDGLLVRELLRFEKDIRTITLVDIDPKILELSTSHPLLQQANQYAFDHRKVNVVQADALQFLRNHQQSYDRIYLDVLFPYDYESSRLYTLEFLGSALRSLSKDGILALLSPIDIEETIEPEKNSLQAIIFSTLAKAGCQHTALAAEQRHSFLLCSKSTKLALIPNYKQSPFFTKVFSRGNHFKFLPLNPYRNDRLVNSILKPTFTGLSEHIF